MKDNIIAELYQFRISKDLEEVHVEFVDAKDKKFQPVSIYLSNIILTSDHLDCRI